MAKQVPQSGGRSAASKSNATSNATTAQRTSANAGSAKTPQAKTPQTKGVSSQLSRGAARRRSAKQPWWRQNMPIIITLVSVVLIIGVFVLIARQSTSSGGGGIGDPVPTDVLNAVTKPDPAIFAKVGTGGLNSPMIHVAGDPLKGANGKPEVFYLRRRILPLLRRRALEPHHGDEPLWRIQRPAADEVGRRAGSLRGDEHLHLPAQHIHQPVS